MGAMSENKWGCSGGAGQEGRTLQERGVKSHRATFLKRTGAVIGSPGPEQ